MRRNHNTSHGVTLIELVIAMVILTAIAIPAAAMIGAQIKGMMTSADLTAAGNLARQQMEKLNNTVYVSVVNGSAASGAYAVDWIVADITGNNSATRKDITLTASRTGSTAALVTLYSSIANVTYAP